MGLLTTEVLTIEVGESEHYTQVNLKHSKGSLKDTRGEVLEKVEMSSVFGVTIGGTPTLSRMRVKGSSFFFWENPLTSWNFHYPFVLRENKLTACRIPNKKSGGRRFNRKNDVQGKEERVTLDRKSTGLKHPLQSVLDDNRVSTVSVNTNDEPRRSLGYQTCYYTQRGCRFVSSGSVGSRRHRSDSDI